MLTLLLRLHTHTIVRRMVKRKLDESKFQPTKCPHGGCDKVLNNKNNYNLRVKSCSKNKEGGLRAMKSYFAASTRDDNEAPSTSSGTFDCGDDVFVRGRIEDNSHPNTSSTSCDQLSSEKNDITGNTVSDSNSDLPDPDPMEESKRCDGVNVDIDGSFYYLYPFHRHDPDFIFFFICSQVRSTPERIILISTTGLR